MLYLHYSDVLFLNSSAVIEVNHVNSVTA